MQAVLPHMVAAQAGSIINISSIAGQRYIGKPQVGYAAAKAGLMQLTKTTAVIHAKDNVRVNCVVPGLMHTPMLNRMAEKYAGGDLDGFIAKRNAMVPMRRMGNAHDVANAVLFLAADESSYVTATEIVVDGGITAATQGDLP
jgi:NAD(P)-dependent dehydrogenase (short-subunit alcohol dehydrogenase family)